MSDEKRSRAEGSEQAEGTPQQEQQGAEGQSGDHGPDITNEEEWRNLPKSEGGGSSW